MVVSIDRFRERNVDILREAQNALNIAFGALLSAYAGNSLADIDNHPFDHVMLAQFFVAVALFILGLCVGNNVILRGEFKLGAVFISLSVVCGLWAHHAGRMLGFEVVILRLLTATWLFALLVSDAALTVIVYLHHRNEL
ncbi:hypothetical protein MOK15_06670 [Sphingobium sp. BYY-5]|uniref:hypothetical protein n=1 Tax=Sphingobium sp. BYY-5 TaxID=2926400 RepID=UPI001FA73010|nr:hypothetical protein [Sphingobium sp. BYY-5]MCI4589773.1 hypothetical protein [Sphingobium sp. BYY-5]